MMNARHVLVIVMLLFATACSSSDNVPKAEEPKPQKTVHETVDTFIQSRISVLDKAKGLEGTLKAAEKKRLRTMQDFEDNGQ